jgi:hypothetical protein
MGETGFHLARMPDGRPIAYQDAYFMRCLEVIATTWNRKLAENRPGNG